MSEKEEQILSKMICSICWCHHVMRLYFHLALQGFSCAVRCGLNSLLEICVLFYWGFVSFCELTHTSLDSAQYTLFTKPWSAKGDVIWGLGTESAVAGLVGWMDSIERWDLKLTLGCESRGRMWHHVLDMGSHSGFQISDLSWQQMTSMRWDIGIDIEFIMSDCRSCLGI